MPHPISRANRLALGAVCLAALMFGLEISSVPVILSPLERLMRGDLKDMQWIMNAYTIACTTVLMAAGTLADRYGRKRIFIISLVCFGLTSLGCGVATDIPLLIALRFLQGMSGGVMLICLLAILASQFRETGERSWAFSMFGVVFGAGLGFGPLVGGAIVATLGWQWVFLIHVPLTALTLLLACTSVTETRALDGGSLDTAGILTLSLGVLCLTYSITEGLDGGGGKLVLGVALVSMMLFILVERRSAHPMFDFSVFRIRRFSGALLGSIGMNFSFWPLMIYLPLYYQAVLGVDALQAGLLLLAYTLPTLVVPPMAERLSLRYQAGVIIPVGLMALGLGFMAMWYGRGLEHADGISMLPGCLLAGVGLGLTNTPVTNTTTGSVPASRAGMASGIDMSARLITLAINISVMGVLLQQGVQSFLVKQLGSSLPIDRLSAMAGMISAGNLSQAAQHLATGDAGLVLVKAALTHGFGVLMLYGGIGACSLAIFSALLFREKTQRVSDAGSRVECR